MNKYIRIYISKILITVIITLVISILIKANYKYKNIFYKYIFDTNFSFTKVSSMYNKYFGSIIKIPTYNSKTVFNENLNYIEKEKYYDGVKLKVENNYVVTSQDSGIVVFIGNKDNYGKVVIIQQITGVDLWYGNINNTNVKLYDYVKKGDVIGEVVDYLYLVYKKDGKILNYEDFI